MAQSFQVNSPNVVYSDSEIRAQYQYHRSLVTTNPEDGRLTVTPQTTEMEIITNTRVPKLGVMLVGMGGNNGSTVMAGVLANKLNVTWHTKEGPQTADYKGSVMQSSTTQLGYDERGNPVYVPLRSMLATVDPNTLVFGGWDISGLNMAEAMRRAQVLDYDLQRQIAPELEAIKPLPSIYYPDFIAANQEDRADNVLPGRSACTEHLEKIRQDIRDFKAANELDKVLVLWTANTERFCEVTEGVHDSEEALIKAIADGHAEVAPSQVFAVASILEGCSYINGSPQNTFVPAIVAMARARQVFIGGDDFKSGQTKIKSALVDFLVSAGIKPESIVSYNHLGNNDGKNLSAPKQFRSKEISKSNVVDDMVASNRILYKKGEHPDHCVVIKYVPYVGDSKRAMDEYTSSIFLGGKNTIVLHNTCEDSLLAAPLILDLILLTELMERVQFHVAGTEKPQKMDAVLSILSFLLKAPMVPEGTPVINAFFRQRACIENVLRACVGLPALNDMLLEAKLRIPDGLKN